MAARASRAKGGVDPKSVDFLAHGTTVVINALTERKGVKVGLITTEGFRDTLEIARGNRPDFFNLHYEKPKPPKAAATFSATSVWTANTSLAGRSHRSDQTCAPVLASII